MDCGRKLRAVADIHDCLWSVARSSAGICSDGVSHGSVSVCFPLAMGEIVGGTWQMGNGCGSGNEYRSSGTGAVVRRSVDSGRELALVAVAGV